MIRSITREVLRMAGHAYPLHRTARVVHSRLCRWATTPLTEPVAIRCRNGATIIAKPSDLIGRQLYLTGTWDPHLLLVLRSLCPPDARTIVDVGANVGYFSLALAMSARGATVNAVEPQPRLAHQLRRSAAETRVSNVVVHEFALSASSGTATLILNQRNLGGSGIAEAMPDGQAAIGIRTVNSAEFLGSLGVQDVDLMKVDVEGHEVHVFRGMETWIAAQRIRAVVFESRSLGDDLSAAAMLAGYGYRLLGIDKGLFGPVIREWDAADSSRMPEDLVAFRPGDADEVCASLGRWIQCPARR
ncbi:MAG: FkbM family methyltransferase [Phycisphaerales bacterium]|nr:FkbM family methyltransferase [Phycisphaerales bacterium]